MNEGMHPPIGDPQKGQGENCLYVRVYTAKEKQSSKKVGPNPKMPGLWAQNVCVYVPCVVFVVCVGVVCVYVCVGVYVCCVLCICVCVLLRREKTNH